MTGEALILPLKRRPSHDGQRSSSNDATSDLSVTVDAPELAVAPADGLGILRTLPLLREASSAGLDNLVAASRARKLEAGELLFTEGQPTRTLFVIHNGTIEISRTRATTALAEVGPGDWLGLFGLLAGRRRATEARAQCPSEVAEIDASAFVRLLTAEPRVREAAKRHFHERLARLLCGSHPLFADLATGERARLAASFHTLDLKAGRHSVLVEPEQTALYAIAHGNLRVAVPSFSEATPLARGHIFGVSAGSVALEPLTRIHLLRLAPSDCASPFFGELAARARARGLFLDRHLFIGDAGIPGLS